PVNPLPTGPVLVEAMTDSYVSADAHSCQSSSHRRGVGGDVDALFLFRQPVVLPPTRGRWRAIYQPLFCIRPRLLNGRALRPIRFCLCWLVPTGHRIIELGRSSSRSIGVKRINV